MIFSIIVIILVGILILPIILLAIPFMIIGALGGVVTIPFQLIKYKKIKGGPISIKIERN